MLSPQPEEIREQPVPIHLLRTLVVDPDLDAGAMVASLAGSRGHDVSQGRSFSEALAAAKAGQVDMVLLRLNHETAGDVAHFLQDVRGRERGQLYLIGITDDDEPSSRIEAWLKRGFDDFITATDQSLPARISNRLAVAEKALIRLRDKSAQDSASVRAARKFEELFHQAASGYVIATARDGFIVEANAAAERILGIPRQDLTQRYLSLVLPELFDRDDFDPQMLGLEEAAHLQEVPYRSPDQQRKWLDIFLAKMPWPPGQALLLEFHDLTRHKEREARRLQESRMDAAGRVLLGVSRELSDSLTTLRGNLEMLGRLPVTRSDMRELLTAATNGCTAAEDLSRSLAALGRKQLGMELKKRPLHLRPLVEKSVPFALLGGKSRPVLQVSDDLWPVEADEALLSDTIRRLVENADLAMPDGGTLFIDARNIRDRGPDSKHQTGVCIRLRDQGTGIAPEHLPHIFDPFFSTRGREGMGLAYCAATIKSHGGHITVESAPGEGTTVSIWLPVNIKTLLTGPAVPPLQQPLTPPLGHAPQTATKARVLFMDDDDQIRLLVQKMLVAHGYDIYCTRDGQEAIEAFRRAHELGAPFDVLLMDLDVRGGMGGMEAVARLRAEHPNIKALLTTGYIDDALLDAHREHGFLGVILKPFQMERLLGAVAKLTARA